MKLTQKQYFGVEANLHSKAKPGTTAIAVDTGNLFYYDIDGKRQAVSGGAEPSTDAPNIGGNTVTNSDNVLVIAAKNPENSVNSVSNSRVLVVAGDSHVVSGTWYGQVTGYGNSVTNNYGGIVNGVQNTTTSYYCNVSGRFAEARSYYTHAMGIAVVSNNTGMFAVGAANVERPNSNSLNGTGNCMFVVGNGTLNTSGGYNSANVRSDAFEVLRNGTVRTPSLTPAIIDSGDGYMVITKDYLFSAEFGNALPTSDPAVAGKLWNNAGTLSVSAG